MSRQELPTVLRDQHRQAVLSRLALGGYTFDNWQEPGINDAMAAVLAATTSAVDEVHWYDVVYDDCRLESKADTPSPIYPISLLGKRSISLMGQSVLDYACQFESLSDYEFIDAPSRYIRVRLHDEQPKKAYQRSKPL